MYSYEEVLEVEILGKVLKIQYLKNILLDIGYLLLLYLIMHANYFKYPKSI